MTTKEAIEETLNMYKKFIKNGKKKKFVEDVNEFLDNNKINNDDILEMIKLRQWQHQVTDMSTLTFALTFAAPIFTSGMAAVLGVWSAISSSINLTATTAATIIGKNPQNFTELMNSLWQMDAVNMLKCIEVVVAGFILYVFIAIILAAIANKKTAVKRRCYELAEEIINKRKDKEKKCLK